MANPINGLVHLNINMLGKEFAIHFAVDSNTAYISNPTPDALSGALALSLGIAIQNFPEGAIVSLPLKTDGKNGLKAFAFGSLSGIVEPIASLITIAFTALITPVLSYLLAFAAGAMIYVVVEELIPESQEGEHSNIATVGVMLGFAIMMVLDMALG